VAGVKQGLAGVQRVLDTGNWHAYLGAVLSEPLKKYRAVQASSDAFVEVPTMGLPDRLVRQGSRSLQKGKEAQVVAVWDCPSPEAQMGPQSIASGTPQ